MGDSWFQREEKANDYERPQKPYRNENNGSSGGGGSSTMTIIIIGFLIFMFYKGCS